MDAKATFALTVESAALALTALLRTAPHSGAGDGRGVLTAAGMALLTGAALLAVLAVVPRMASGGPSRPGVDFIYFGHLRGLAPDELTHILRTADPLPALSRQLVTMSVIAWRKHRFTQGSLVLAAAGLVTVALAGAVAG
ncbi:Pycsar system effector family protein [Streptomyces sp. NPDC046831]|uniref:Pycsar system effector family protein n=1 Tax=Streptomyces sp. NPDC046831 TaxID=3154805 RepID=UPI0033EA8467